MIENFNPYELNIQVDIEVRTVDKSTGEEIETWAVQNAGVWMARLAPPRGRETTEAMQRVGVQIDTFKLRNEGLTITKANHRFSHNGEKFYVTGKRPFRKSINMLAVDTESRDN